MPKVALFYDWLNQWGGAERVLLDLLKLYPDAPVFTLIHDPSKTPWLPKQTQVITSDLNRLPFSKSNPIFYTAFYDYFLEQLDFTGYDIVISTTSVLGHCLLTPPNSLFVTYFHNINRHLYSKNYLHFYQNIDKIYINRPDYYFCNSQTVCRRLNSTYGISAQIINPGIDTDFFTPSLRIPDKYFLVVSRLVAHKKIDLAIEACGQLGLKLKIVGTGRDLSYLKLIAKKYQSIEFIGPVSNLKLKKLYQNCQTLICPQTEDFGLAPIEAQACGRPVIAYNSGGITETVIADKTGLFFDQPTVSSLKNCLNKFSSSKFNSKICRQNSIKFSQKNFMLNFDRSLKKLWQKHQTTSL